ncbi:unnamed protein product [Closterium sp. NIES-54]
MDLEQPASDGLLRLRAVPTTSTLNPGDNGPATMEEEAGNSKSAPAAPNNKERTTTPATGTGWGDPSPAVSSWGEILTPEEAATIGGGWGDIGATGGAGWGQPTPAYPEAPGLPPTDVAAIDPYWATRGTSWGGPPLPDQYAPDTPEHVQELEEEVTYEFFSKAAELPEPPEEAPPLEQVPHLISVTRGECIYHLLPMEGLPASEWPEAASFPQLLITGDVAHSSNTDDIAKIPKEALEHLSKRRGRGAGGSGEAQAQGQPHDSAMAPMQPSLGPPRDEPRVFGLDKFNDDNFAKWSFNMENIFDHYDLLEVMEGTEKRPENDPEKSPWVRKRAQDYLLLGQAAKSVTSSHSSVNQRRDQRHGLLSRVYTLCNSGGSGGVGTANGGTMN